MSYNEKASNYFGNIRIDLINFLNTDQRGLKTLEVGAAYAETLHYLKSNGIASEAIGIDIFEDLANKQNYKPIDHYIFGNIEEMELPEYNNYFDLILLPDVLEHLIEPQKVLHKLSKYIKAEGTIVVSMPNIRHFSAFIKIFLKGNFKYEESGLFDNTHLRFYCRKDIQDLLTSSGFEVVKQEGSIRNYKGMSITKIFNILTFGLLEEFFSYQYFFKIKKAKSTKDE
ncbi:MAG: class I SAM-dependent methyltransferase [Flavobacterium sp.]